MKKTFIYGAMLSVVLLANCQNGARDSKNDAEYYPNTDTTDKMENLNNGNPDSSSSNAQHNSGDIH
jgi:hypothetical protein